MVETDAFQTAANREEMERGKGEGERPKEKASVDKSEHLQVGGPPLTGCAVFLARPAGPGRALWHDAI